MIDQYLIGELERVNGEYRDTFRDMVRVWSEGIVFTWHWWLELGLSLLPWVFWIYVHKRENAHRLLSAGFLTLVISSVLDMLGIYLGLWEYRSVLLPVVPAYLPWDWSVMPVTAMLFYQFKPDMSPLLKSAIFGAIGSFAAEPLFELLGIYHRIAWEYWYSLPVYMAVYLFGWLVLRRRPENAHR